MNNITRFWQELKRRNVVRRNTVYAATAFVILELVSILIEPFGLPDWTLKLVIVLLSIGFIISVIISWIYDFKPEGGFVKTKSTNKIKNEDKTAVSSSWKIASYLSFVVIVGLIVFNIVSNSSRSKETSILEKSIAVLPFENMSDDDEHAYFGDAMTDEIIMQLYKINQFNVRSRTSIMQYKNTRKTSPEIGQELEVNYLIEGSAQRFEDQIRIRVQLIHSSTDEHLWGEIYEGNWSDILSVQSRIAKEIADELKTVLTVEEIEDIEKIPTDNPEAFEYYLKAHYFQNHRTREGFSKAIANYQEAIRIDPHFADAYSGFAFSKTLQGIYGFQPMRDVLPTALEFATKALELNNNLGEAHASLALIHWMESDFSAAVEEYQKSINLDPNNAEAHHGFSYILAMLGRGDEAIEEAKIAVKLEPINPIMKRGLGYTYYLNRQFELAISECNKCIEIDSTQVAAYKWLWWAYHAAGMYDEAIASLSKYLIFLNMENIANKISTTYSDSGYSKAMNQLIEISMNLTIRDISGHHSNSILYALIGERDKAFTSIEKYLLEDYPWRFINLKSFPYYDSISSDPRAAELLRKLEL